MVLLAAGTSWNAGNIGPVTAILSEKFSVSLTAVGLLSGTVFFAGLLFTSAPCFAALPYGGWRSSTWGRSASS